MGSIFAKNNQKKDNKNNNTNNNKNNNKKNNKKNNGCEIEGTSALYAPPLIFTAHPKQTTQVYRRRPYTPPRPRRKHKTRRSKYGYNTMYLYSKPIKPIPMYPISKKMMSRQATDKILLDRHCNKSRYSNRRDYLKYHSYV